MIDHFQTVLETVVVNPACHLSDVAILTESQRHQQLVEWNDTKADYSQDQSLPALFEAQVERTPDSIAVVFDSGHLTYVQLGRRANQLARYLQKSGVGTGVLVGILLEQSLDMATTIN